MYMGPEIRHHIACWFSNTLWDRTSMGIVISKYAQIETFLWLSVNKHIFCGPGDVIWNSRQWDKSQHSECQM